MKTTTKKGLDRYAEHHGETGSFLRAVLENNLKESFARADDDNARDMHEIVAYVYNELPGACWGSPERVREWLAQKPKTEEGETCPKNA